MVPESLSRQVLSPPFPPSPPKEEGEAAAILMGQQVERRGDILAGSGINSPISCLQPGGQVRLSSYMKVLNDNKHSCVSVIQAPRRGLHQTASGRRHSFIK